MALPDQLFYNTGISTYFWIVTNRKRPERRGKVQLIDASGFSQKMRKSLGNKRNELSDEHIDEITRIYGEFAEGEHCKIFANEDFGYRKITVERPLRLNFQASPERIERLKEQKAFQKRTDQDEVAGDARGDAGRADAGAAGVRGGAEERRQGRRPQARRSAEEGGPCGALRARRDRPRLPRRQGRSRARPRAARHRERAARRGRRTSTWRARCCPTCPTPGSARPCATRRTAASARWATRSTSTATSTSTCRRGRSRRSRPTSASWRRRSCDARGDHGDEQVRHVSGPSRAVGCDGPT